MIFERIIPQPFVLGFLTLYTFIFAKNYDAVLNTQRSPLQIRGSKIEHKLREYVSGLDIREFSKKSLTL